MNSEDYRILLVDDEPDILEFLGYNLKKEGFEVFTASNGKEAIKMAQKSNPHLILMDVMMPEMDGIEACNEIRKNSSLSKVIIAFLTARSEDYSQIAGFDAGGDDYIAKPIKPKVLISKIKGLLRRSNEAPVKEQSNLINHENLVIDKEKYVVFLNNVKYDLPRKEFELLSLLASKPNKVFTRDEILNRIWGNDVVVTSRTIDVHIRKIREKLKIENIKTIKGVGYKFED